MVTFTKKRVKILHFRLFLLRNGAAMKTLPLFAVLLLLTSCQTEKPGSLRLNHDITASFEACTILPGYDYYYSGPEAQPDVILAVKKEYTFEKGLWKAIALDQKQLCDWMRVIDPDIRGGRSQYDGYAIYSGEGKEVGLWYSRNWADWTTIKEEDGKLIIFTPRDRRRKLSPFGGDRDF